MSLVQNAAVLMAGQVVSKLFTFSLNQLLFSYTSPSALGITQLIEFVLDYTFFLSREACRLSIAKLPKNKNTVQWTINYSIFSIVLFILLGLPIIYWKIIEPNDPVLINSLSPFNLYHIVLVILLCGLFELSTEAYYNINQYIKLDFKTRTKIESISGFVRCMVQFISVIFVAPFLGMKKTDINAYVFGYLIGQLMYSLTILILYWHSFSFKLFYPVKVENSWFELDSWNYFKSIFIQQIFKNFLTVGDKFVITSLLSIETQGYYSFVSNYGSLIARMLFLPIEESTRITISSFFKNEKDLVQTKKDYIELSKCLSNVIKIYIYLLLLLIIFAPLNTKFLLSLMFKNFSSSNIISAFKLYWIYVVILAVNGILEALFQSLFHSKENVNNYSIFMFVNSIVFLSTLILLIGKFNYGLNGLIIANIINMILRIIYCFVSVIKFIKSKQDILKIPFVLDLSKYAYFLVSCIIFTIFQYVLFNGDVQTFKQFILSAICGGILVVLAAATELHSAKEARMKNNV